MEQFKSRRLTASEKAFSKTLIFPLLRKEFIMRLNAGEKFENIEEEFKHRLNEAQNAKKQAELDEQAHKEHDENILHAIKEAQKDPMDMELLRSMHMIPCGYHRYYFSAEEMLEHSLQDFKLHATRAEQVLETEESLFELYRNPSLHTMPPELNKRGGAYYSDTACECISAIHNDKGSIMVVNIENKGAVNCLPEDCCAEVSCVISAKGASPVAYGEMPEAVRGLLQMMKAMEQCTIQAALTGDYGSLLQAFALNPLIPDGAEARRVLDELLVAHEKYLPQFAEIIAKRKEEGIFCEDSVVQNLVRAGH